MIAFIKIVACLMLLNRFSNCVPIYKHNTSLQASTPGDIGGTDQTIGYGPDQTNGYKHLDGNGNNWNHTKPTTSKETTEHSMLDTISKTFQVIGCFLMLTLIISICLFWIYNMVHTDEDFHTETVYAPPDIQPLTQLYIPLSQSVIGPTPPPPAYSVYQTV